MTRNVLIWLLVAAVLGIVLAALIVIPRAPMPVHEGTAPSVVTGNVGDEGLEIGASGASEPRDAKASSTSGRGSRGSGIEGVTSGGTTTAPPDGG